MDFYLTRQRAWHGRGPTGFTLAIQSMYLDDSGTELPEKQLPAVKNSGHISAYTSTASYSSKLLAILSNHIKRNIENRK